MSPVELVPARARTSRRSGRGRPDWRVIVLILIGLLALVGSVLVPPASAQSTPGSAGTDTSLPATESQVTIRGRGEFASLEVTVNQTRNLVNQAVSLAWKGGEPTFAGANRFSEDYLQIMQCWGDPDGAVPDNPGPPPEQCVFGASDGAFGGRLGNLFPSGSNAVTRIIARSSWASFDPTQGVYEPETTALWKPFRAVDGQLVGPQVNRDYQPGAQSSYWLNPYFDAVTTNEVVGARTSSAGTGAELFEVNTGVESSGLGCGQRLQLPGETTPRVPPCWIVVVPRGSEDVENSGSPFGSGSGVMTSPLSPEVWKNRIAIPIEFNPVDTPCSIDAQDRPIVGTELALAAVVSWQPTLCATEGLPPFTYGTAPDAAARAQILSAVPGAPGMAVSSNALDPAVSTPQDPTLYAPLTLSGAVIAFNIERIPSLTAPEAMDELSGVRVQNLDLTPRLVAKLLTQSYRSQTSIRESQPYEWATTNPVDMSRDPDFLRFNPEFELLQVRQFRSFGGLLAPGANSDLAREVWAWVLADPEAKAWLDGAPDQWGMVVNPVYNTTAAGNPSGAPFADPIPEAFPKADPYCFQGANVGVNGDVVPPRLCGTDWLPYVQSLGEAARSTRLADDRAKINENQFAITSDQVWGRAGPQQLGTRAVLSITDTGYARRYGVQAARLSRAGDDGDDRRFVAPDPAALTAGVAAMRPVDGTSVRVPDPAAPAPGAYPLTMLTYAAVRPAVLQQAAREEYASFLEYAGGDGQVQGLEQGQLPPGYAPLPAEMRGQTKETATALRTWTPPPPPADATGGGSDGDGGLGAVPSATAPPLGQRASGTAGGGPTATVPADELAIDVEPADTEAGDTGTGILTPVLALATSRYFLVVLAVVSLLSALAITEITKRPRRASAASIPDGSR